MTLSAMFVQISNIKIMENLFKTNIKIFMALAIALALLPLTFKFTQDGFQFILMTKHPIICGFIAVTSILLNIKISRYFSQNQRIGLCLFYLLLPFVFLYNAHGLIFILIKTQPAIALGYFGVGLALLFNTLKINRAANNT